MAGASSRKRGSIGCSNLARFTAIMAICGGSTPVAALFPSASSSSYYARGAGGNLTWIDPENEFVAVLRWTDPAAMDGFMQLTMAALEGCQREKV